MDLEAIHAFIAKFRYGVVSSVDKHGEPQSALVGIAVTPELEIVFDTLTTSRKHANLSAHPACSLVIGLGADGPLVEQTLQYQGVAFEPNGIRLRHYQQYYFAVWPDGASRLSWPGLTYFVVRPTWLRFSDFGQSPPFVFEHRFAS